MKSYFGVDFFWDSLIQFVYLVVVLFIITTLALDCKGYFKIKISKLKSVHLARC